MNYNLEDKFSPIVERLVDTVGTALTSQGRKARRVVVLAPGEQPAWDECEDGFLYSRYVTVMPHVGNTRGTGAPCGVLYWVVTAAVGIIRCVSVVNDGGNSPSAREISRDGLEMSADMAVLLGTVPFDAALSEVQGWVPLGAEGGCAGGEIIVTYRVMM